MVAPSVKLSIMSAAPEHESADASTGFGEQLSVGLRLTLALTVAAAVAPWQSNAAAEWSTGNDEEC